MNDPVDPSGPHDGAKKDSIPALDVTMSWRVELVRAASWIGGVLAMLWLFSKRPVIYVPAAMVLLLLGGGSLLAILRGRKRNDGDRNMNPVPARQVSQE
jgi:hypothetical protein